jgi:nucleotide-binding universal stress UspA family protein
MAAIAAEAKGADAYRDVFAPQDETEAALQALTYADGLCAYFGAHLSGLMIGLVPYYPMSLSGPSPEGWMQAQQQANEEASASEQRLRAIFATLASSNDLKRVDAFEQEAARFHARRARVADLTIMGWTQSELVDSERAVFEACLFESGRPLLIVPARHVFRAPPQRALVAWNGSREAARAVREALPLLRRAKLTRIVAVDSEESDIGGYEDTVAQLARHLERHQTAVETKRAHGGSRDVGSTLVEEAEQFGAGLIVLGGYAYVRAGAWVYGAGTRSALAHARVPMLFAN